MISEELYTFLKEWLDWAEGDVEDTTSPFDTSYGLCTNYYLWVEDVNGLGDGSGELNVLFDFNPYPFGEDAYETYSLTHTQHLCPKRLAWVKQQIKQYEENNND